MDEETLKSTEKKIREILKSFTFHHYREKALEEVAKAEAAGIPMYNVKTIIDSYPRFDHLGIIINEGDRYCFRLSVNAEYLKEHPEAIHTTAVFIHKWMDEQNSDKKQRAGGR